MGVFVKICGLRGGDSAASVAGLGPDALGFVFWPGSSRAVTADEVAEWTRGWPDGICKVGVFVDEPADAIRRIADRAGLDLVQLHGPPDAGRRALIDRPVWQVVRLDRPGDIADAGSPIDAWLIDSYSAQAPGGTGAAVDWEQARAFIARSAVPVVLAGGLNAANVADAIRRARPWGVDVSSGVEAAPGRKDLAKVKAFIEQCRSC